MARRTALPINQKGSEGSLCYCISEAYFNNSQSECTIPGNHINIHSTILINKSLPTPFIKNTAKGGNKSEITIINILFEEAAIILSLVLFI
jgi:hypothetical protein